MFSSDFFSWPKLAYTIILIGLITIFVRELINLWFDKKLYIGRFQVFESGASNAANERSFALQVINWHHTLRNLFEQEERTRKLTMDNADSATIVSIQRNLVQEDNTWWPSDVSPINDPKSALANLEISVQGVNVKDILTRLRQWVSPPNEISGIIEKNEEMVSGIIEWSKAPVSLQDSRFYNIVGEKDLSKTAFRVAAGIIWAQACANQKNLAGVPREEFSDWARIWFSYISLRRKSNDIIGVEKEDVEKLEESIRFLIRAKQRGYRYPEIYRLCADLIDMLPADKKTPEYILIAQNDREYYAQAVAPKKKMILISKSTDKSDAMASVASGLEAAAAVRAIGRPALRLKDGKISDEMTETWRVQIEPYRENVKRADLATGYGYIGKGSAANGYFTGFVIAPNIIATVNFVVPQELRQRAFPVVLKGSEYEGKFSFDATASTADVHNALQIEEVLYAAGEDGIGLAILKVAGHDVRLHPPLQIERVDAAADLPGRYVFTVGYPARDARMVPQEFISAVLNDDFQVKRLMPGRIITASDDKGVPRKVTSDASTFGGTAGGPVVDIHTGQVLAIHHSGIWDEKKGKFAYSTVLSDLLGEETFPEALRKQILDNKP